MKCDYQNCEARKLSGCFCPNHLAEYKRLGDKVITEIGVAYWCSEGRSRVREAYRNWDAFYARGHLS